MSNWIIHIEASRSWLSSTSTTLCGLTITEVKVSGYLMTVTCPACKTIKAQAKAAKKAAKKGARKAKPKGGWW
ncbi:hypothetical protein M8C13_36220 [Crossiella sp. SN42]|uniref:hypothetical protein n=1 Tax=Crossiella sp. SN42 TaxID=2944808 RepID=UPI00207C75CC|nr:hypothetical protein [Crossiella sp. SN42]MCO1581210.1 hypothetical protein [Crossiella sp. SN42]